MAERMDRKGSEVKLLSYHVDVEHDGKEDGHEKKHADNHEGNEEECVPVAALKSRVHDVGVVLRSKEDKERRHRGGEVVEILWRESVACITVFVDFSKETLPNNTVDNEENDEHGNDVNQVGQHV